MTVGQEQAERLLTAKSIIESLGQIALAGNAQKLFGSGKKGRNPASDQLVARGMAGSVVAIIERVGDGALPSTGFLKQEKINLDAFLATPTGGLWTSS